MAFDANNLYGAFHRNKPVSYHLIEDFALIGATRQSISDAFLTDEMVCDPEVLFKISNRPDTEAMIARMVFPEGI